MVALTHLVCFLFLLRKLLMLWPPVSLSVVFSLIVVIPGLQETGQCHPYFEGSTVLCCQLPTNFHNISVVKGVKKGKVFYGQEPSSGESTTAECGVNYQLITVMLLK